MRNERFASCIDLCKECADACDNCAASCLQEEDVSGMRRCIALDIDCAALCRLAVGFMARGSDMVAAVCEACAEVCDVCAEECGQHEMEHCKRCATACRKCAEECRRMAGTAGRTSQARSDSEAHAH